jgi:tryptophan synthase alpha chain
LLVNRISNKFSKLAAANRKALIPFITAGALSLQATVPVMRALVVAGADVIDPAAKAAGFLAPLRAALGG